MSPWDDSGTIRKAWLALVRRYHPDLAATDKEAANRRLAEINDAFDVVSDPAAINRKIDELRRAEASRHTARDPRPHPEKHDRRAEERRPSERTREDRRKPGGAASTRRPSPAPSLDPSELRKQQAARAAFDRALRILASAPGTREKAIYL